MRFTMYVALYPPGCCIPNAATHLALVGFGYVCTNSLYCVITYCFQLFQQCCIAFNAEIQLVEVILTCVKCVGGV